MCTGEAMLIDILCFRELVLTSLYLSRSCVVALIHRLKTSRPSMQKVKQIAVLFVCRCVNKLWTTFIVEKKNHLFLNNCVVDFDLD